MATLSDLLEPTIFRDDIDGHNEIEVALAVDLSKAISAKRQADALERIAYMLELFPDKFSG